MEIPACSLSMLLVEDSVRLPALRPCYWLSTVTGSVIPFCRYAYSVSFKVDKFFFFNMMVFLSFIFCKSVHTEVLQVVSVVSLTSVVNG